MFKVLLLRSKKTCNGSIFRIIGSNYRECPHSKWRSTTYNFTTNSSPNLILRRKVRINSNMNMNSDRTMARPHSKIIPPEIFQAINGEEHEMCKKIFDEIIKCHRYKKDATVRLVEQYLKTCSKAEDLSRVLEVASVLRFINKGNSDNLINTALLRCYGTAGDIPKQLALLEEMRNNGSVIRQSMILTVVESACKANELESTMQVLTYNSHPLRKKHGDVILAHILAMVGRNPRWLLDDDKKVLINLLMEETKSAFSGLKTEQMTAIQAAFNNQMKDEVDFYGVVVTDIVSVPGKIKSAQDIKLGVVTSTISANHTTNKSSNSTLSVPAEKTQRYTIRKLVPPEHSYKSGDSVRMVEISSQNCRCSNCLQVLTPNRENEVLREEVREALTESLVKGLSDVEKQSFEQFSFWMAGKGDYDYIVDGDSVHSVKQLAELVQSLKKSRKHRVLVLFSQRHFDAMRAIGAKHHRDERHLGIRDKNKSGQPFIVDDPSAIDEYSDDFLPLLSSSTVDHVKNSGNSSSGNNSSGDIGRGSGEKDKAELSDEKYTPENYAKRLETIFRQSDSVYVLPENLRKVHTECLVYSSVNAVNDNTIYPVVVTNRRWKSADQSMLGINEILFDRWKAEKTAQFSFLKDSNKPVVHLPGYISEFQKSAAPSSNWHIPATDGTHWLCLNIDSFEKSQRSIWG